VESNWDNVETLFVPVDSMPDKATLEDFASKTGFDAELKGPVADFLARLLTMFEEEDTVFLEINPFTVLRDSGEAIALDAVVELDETARFRHQDWDFEFASDIGRPMSHAEKMIKQIDEQVKGSVKFVELGGDTALLPAGGGASVFLADAIVRNGGTLANYAEYSGDPPDWAVEALTERVCSLKGIKRIIIGGAIANFTDVKSKRSCPWKDVRAGRDLGPPRRPQRGGGSPRDPKDREGGIQDPRVRPEDSPDRHRGHGILRENCLNTRTPT
jgi:ATP-citrate lyase beta-subunit